MPQSKPSRPARPIVEVREVGEPVNLDLVVKRYVEILFELEGLKPSVASPPIASVG